MPLYALGLMGATRRMQHYPNTHWQPLMLVALAGAVVILLGIALTVVQIAVSIRQRRRQSRPHRRSLERTDARVVDSLAAAGLEFHPAAER